MADDTTRGTTFGGSVIRDEAPDDAALILELREASAAARLARQQWAQDREAALIAARVEAGARSRLDAATARVEAADAAMRRGTGMAGAGLFMSARAADMAGLDKLKLEPGAIVSREYDATPRVVGSIDMATGETFGLDGQPVTRTLTLKAGDVFGNARPPLLGGVAELADKYRDAVNTVKQDPSATDVIAGRKAGATLHETKGNPADYWQGAANLAKRKRRWPWSRK